MFGYATNETESFMPAAIHLSHRLVEQQAKIRKQKKSPLPWLRPDAKSQVTLRYENGKATAIDAVVLSTQHVRTEPEGWSNRARGTPQPCCR